MTNKTPIQELIFSLNNEFYECIDTNYGRGVLFAMNMAREVLQKEKAFAFDCFEAARSESYGEHDYFDFDVFWRRYAEQHTN